MNLEKSGKSSEPNDNDVLETSDDVTSSSSSNDIEFNRMEDVLLKFRSQWHKEILSDTEKSAALRTEKLQNIVADDVEYEAKRLFTQGVENEQQGRLYEAIQYYRRAVQLVPDIELKLYESVRLDRPDVNNTGGGSAEINVKNVGQNEMLDEAVDLTTRLQMWLSTSPTLCAPAVEQRATHISSLPFELLVLIFRWIVSSDLDIRSLEMCSLVCRGFFLCSRDTEIWRIVCRRLWGVHCGRLSNETNTWRDFYMKTPHLLFNGCYISKTTYVRHGENSFQDQFYRPWHIVEYFRYLRFFPEGRALMMTTADMPSPTVLGHLRCRSAKYPAVIFGHYRLKGDVVMMVMSRTECEPRERDPRNNRYRGRHRPSPEAYEETYNIELKLTQWKRHKQLTWSGYRVFSRRGATETVTNFEVQQQQNNKFPPFWFSRVKSYTAESESPLA